MDETIFSQIYDSSNPAIYLLSVNVLIILCFFLPWRHCKTSYAAFAQISRRDPYLLAGWVCVRKIKTFVLQVQKKTVQPTVEFDQGPVRMFRSVTSTLKPSMARFILLLQLLFFNFEIPLYFLFVWEESECIVRFEIAKYFLDRCFQMYFKGQSE